MDLIALSFTSDWGVFREHVGLERMWSWSRLRQMGLCEFIGHSHRVTRCCQPSHGSPFLFLLNYAFKFVSTLLFLFSGVCFFPPRLFIVYSTRSQSKVTLYLIFVRN